MDDIYIFLFSNMIVFVLLKMSFRATNNDSGLLATASGFCYFRRKIN